MLASKGFGNYAVPKKGTILFSSATSAFRGGARTAQFACGKHALRALSQVSVSVSVGGGTSVIRECCACKCVCQYF